jgi:hypothetical protein
MGKINDFLRDMGFEIALFVAGCLGSLSNTSNQRLPGWQRLLAFLSGGAIANYLTPIIYTYLNINKSAMFGIAFLLGFSGMEGVKYVIGFAKSKLKKKE